jgi:hypothetical protein
VVAGAMPPVVTEEVVATAEVKALFAISTTPVPVAGCVITEGTFARSGPTLYRLMRDRVVVAEVREGAPRMLPLPCCPRRPDPSPPACVQSKAVASLFHLKERVETVKKGTECGIVLEGVDGCKVGDRIVAVLTTKTKPKLEVRYDYTAPTGNKSVAPAASGPAASAAGTAGSQALAGYRSGSYGSPRVGHGVRRAGSGPNRSGSRTR